MGELSNNSRSSFWRCCLRVNLEEMKVLYKKLLEEEVEDIKDCQQIDKDVNRCLRYHQQFAERYGTGQCKLYRILKAYARYNNATKYTQGMSTLAAILLVYFTDEAEAFGALCQLFSNFSFNYWYADGLVGILNFFDKFEHMVEVKIPQLHAHLKRVITDGMGMSYSSLFLPNWILECYYSTLPFSLVVKVWDMLLLIGPSFLFSFALSLLAYLEESLVSTNAQDQIITKLKHIQDSLEPLATQKKILRSALKMKIQSLFDQAIMDSTRGQ
eukprot:TRINITY_DN7222_c0_g1_i1.p1 TRINITY_DN7222_c0_g1~~TRINITY_DN7222_c0_g1_i1.p1  ORF type:complete len:271 (+),score=57.86 TRINITY_DN7222_c0_g1_i1:600-1412(+)